MSAIQPPTEDPLEGHYRYETVKYLSSGSYGFVVLAKDLTTGGVVGITRSSSVPCPMCS